MMLTLLQYTRTYPRHRGTGTRCAKIQYRTRTRGTRFGNTAGLPVPMLNPKKYR